MDGACSINGRNEKYIQNFGQKSGRGSSGNIVIDGMIILEKTLAKLGRKLWT
jgi:hypothetical protein